MRTQEHLTGGVSLWMTGIGKKFLGIDSFTSSPTSPVLGIEPKREQ